MSEAYEFRLLTLSSAELLQLSALLHRVFPKARHLTERYLQWKYAGNPDGRAIGCNAYLAGELVGHMAALPMQGRLHGKTERGLFFVNGAVHPAHRGRRLQSRISAAMFEEAQRQGYAYCFGTGNRYSTGPLLTRFSLIGPLEARIGIGAPRRRQAVALDFERLWSEEALRWRLANPERLYGLRDHDGRLAVTAPAAPGISALLYYGPNDWHLTGNGNSSRAPLRLWIGRDPRIDWSQSAFLPIPIRLRPSPLNLVFRDLSGRHTPPDPARTVFRAIDFDPY
ncbi:MAG TPA: GNAT family N-acetyltransferase [Allosphingosinicella sp.]|nr:GNAT family N-acetyltransferase [Allosphingosinicella sp.]